jgi:hypothetical protein
MSYQTAQSIARRTPVEEFGYHATASDEPCPVAFSVSYDAGEAWLSWPADDGSVNVPSVAGYSPGPDLGRFYCTGFEQQDGDTREGCHHHADKHSGAITVRFTIAPTPS